VNWHVPRAPKNIDISRVPPVTIKIAIGEFKNLAQHVKIGMEAKIEPDEP
jgi:hypothetical protein